MREMKDSGNCVIGKIPVLWNKIRLKYLCDIQTGNEDTQNANPEGEYPFYVRSPIVERCNRYTFDGEGILVAGDGAGAGRIFHHVYGKYAVHQRVYRLSNFKYNSDFIHYYLSNLFPNEMDKGSAQSTVPSMRLPMLLNFQLFLPKNEEGNKISNFLDSKCAEIDALTAAIQAEINILEQYKKSVITEAVAKGLDPTVEMKDSGIEWIGKIPRHWNLIRGKYILRCLQKPVYEDDSVITCFRDGEVTLRSNRREDGFTISEKEIGYQGVDVGDLIVHGMDGFAGAIGISDSRGKASPVLNVLATSQNKRYIMYYLRGMAYTDVFVALATGIRVRSCDLRWNKLAELLYPIPPENEQDKIVEYIDTVISETDTIIQGKKEFLKHLANYKKSLIYEYVTGKKEVPVTNTNAVIAIDPQAILLGGIVKRIGNSQHGRTQLQKLLYLCNTHLGLNLNIQYYRYEHGPYDVHLNDYIRELVKNQWFNEKKQDKNRMLVSGKKWEEFEQNYPNPFGEKKQEIGKLFKQLKALSTRQIERIATLYAAWNDFLLDGITPSDDQIIQDVVTNWTENKANFQYSTWQESLNQLKQYGLIPKGTGLHTLPRP